MAELTKYALVDATNQTDGPEYDDYDEAAADNDGTHAIVARTYIYDDEELIETPCGCEVWPCRHCTGAGYAPDPDDEDAPDPDDEDK